MLLGTLGASLLGNIIASQGVIAKSVGEETKSKSQGRGVNRAGEEAKSVSEDTKSKRQGRGIVKTGYGKKKELLMPPHPLTNFEIQKCYQSLTRFNGVYFRDNLPKIKDGVYVIR